MENSVHVIIGGAGGIGRALTQRLMDRGATVIIASRDAQRLAEAKASLGCETVQLDARDPEAVAETLKSIHQAHGRIDGLVNCAGSILLKPAHRTSPAEWREVMSTNLDTSFYVVRAGTNLMRKTGGSIVLFSTVAAVSGLANHAAIAAAKAGVIGLARSAAASYASKNIRVNVIAPGLVESPLSQRLVANEASRKVSESMHPLGRIGQPEDIAPWAELLLDPSQQWVTGQVFSLDGGMSTLRTPTR